MFCFITGCIASLFSCKLQRDQCHSWILSFNYKPVHFNFQLVFYKHDSQQQPRQQKGQAPSSGQQIKQKAKKHVLERKVSLTEIVLFTGLLEWNIFCQEMVICSSTPVLDQHWHLRLCCFWVPPTPVPSAAGVAGSGHTNFACESALPSWFCAALLTLRSSSRERSPSATLRPCF